MTRDKMVLMLLATGPARRSELVRDTGWGIAETNAVVDRLMTSGEVVVMPAAGNNQFASKVLCLPGTRAAMLARRKGGAHA